MADTIYLIEKTYKSGNAICEVDTTNNVWLLSELISQVSREDDICSITEFCRDEMTVRDVTEDIARACFTTGSYEEISQVPVWVDVCLEEDERRSLTSERDCLSPHEERLGCHSQGVGRYGAFGA